MNLTYSALEDFLAHLHGVAPSKRTALKGRLKHFQRLKWPAGTNQGKGARVQYGIGQTMSLAVGMEMLQLGLTPERVVFQLSLGGGMLADGFLDALDRYGPEADPICYIFSPESLSALRGDGAELHFQALMTSRSELGKLLEETTPFATWRRFAVIDMSDLLTSYIEFFVGKGLADPENLRAPLENWLSVESRFWDARMEKSIVDQEA